MRKVVLIIGLLLLMQAAWVPASYAAPPPADGSWHTVRWGETLFSIGRVYGVNPYSICRANGLRNCDHVWAGQSLWIPEGRGYPDRGCDYNQGCYPERDRQPDQCRDSYPCQDRHWECSAHYTVRCGDTLYSIGRRYGVGAWSIAATNGIYNLNMIYAGQTLCIPAGRY